MIFVDTSAFLSVLVADDSNHDRAFLCWVNLLEDDRALFTNNYVIVEAIAIIQKRLGLEKAHHFQKNILPFLKIEWIDETQHNRAIAEVFQANQRKFSLVDCSAFQTMENLEIDTVFTFDKHFREQGFKVIP